MEDATEKKQPSKPAWVPIAKDAARLLPKDRSYTEVEALFSLALDHNNDRPATVLGYARLWGWGQCRVTRFLDRVGLKVQYPSDTSKVQKQPGKLAILERGDQRGENREINFIDFRQLHESAGRKRGDQRGQLIRKREKEKKESAKDPRVKVFITWFCEKFERAFSREYIVGSWPKAGAQVKALLALPLSWENLQYTTIEFLLDKEPWLEKAGHHFGTLKTKIGQNAYSKYLDPDFMANNRKHIITETGEAAYSGAMTEGDV